MGHAGFTLVELISVVALVGILLAIALPSYRQYHIRVQSRQAAQDIAMMAASIKQFYADARDYPADLAATGFAAQRDPWGQPYVYYNIEANGRGHARKDHALNPINSDFDLYSIGPDGDTHTQVSNRQSADDVLRANNGAYIGLGADYGGR